MNRRNFVLGAATIPALSLSPALPSLFAEPTLEKHSSLLTFGVATYSLRKFPRDKAIPMLKELGITNVNIKDVHLSMKDTPEQIRAGTKEFIDAGFKIVGGGNVTMAKEEQLRPAFEYAKAAGFPMIICAPSHEMLPKIEVLVKEFNIPVAIHNHGPEDKNLPSPLDVLAAVKHMDPRMGLCIDVGHTIRTGTDIVTSIKAAGKRLLDMHVKDLAKSTDRDSQVAVGQGVIPFPAIFQQLIRMGYKGSVDLEYEIKADTPMEGMKESFAYMHGVLDGMKG